MVSELVKPSGEKYTENEFPKVIAAVQRIVENMLQDYDALAVMLYYCTSSQAGRLKKLLRNYLASSLIDRLYYYGMRLVLKDSKAGMARHLALKPNGLRKPEWERLDLETKKNLNNPDYAVSVARPNTTPIRKPIKDLNALELRQILGNQKILTVEQQLSKIRFREESSENKREKALVAEVPEDHSRCERTINILLAKNGLDLILISKNHRQHVSIEQIVKFMKNRGYVIYKIE